MLRGLHYQIQHAQGKLVRVVEGEVFDVAVDIARSCEFRQMGRRDAVGGQPSAALGAARIRARLRRLSEAAQFLYKTTDYWYEHAQHRVERSDIGIEWPIDFEPLLAAKDAGVSV
ncbi:dTDP-4-dehydrorhamnose 3,5-epimerase [Burkholderia multivorans]|uniref:dTDP-4-dehydrorhamnose 3,5-epimerase family protein n=1 Tax=Burkholderia multivorans TaxID=87883 RepID=UPI00201B1AF0|nr:dTDP-4-dehydrorhamnose 3,5-epimerase family protein [Burkholderia multivorans]MCL4630626.1 dTDP-4-dehydrorhamnose 3,5-epimerase [Burkholderia multivorans]